MEKAIAGIVRLVFKAVRALYRVIFNPKNNNINSTKKAKGEDSNFKPNVIDKPLNSENNSKNSTDVIGDFDLNFKLVVIDELLNKDTSFSAMIEKHQEKHDEFIDSDDCYDEEKNSLYTKEALAFFEEIVFTKEDLDMVEELTFDGGLEVYELILPFWDGEDDSFDIHSIQGIKKLHNLKKVNYISIIDEQLIKEIEDMGIEVI